MVIIQGKHHMESWYRERLSQGETIILSESGFTNDEIAIRFLTHFIRHTGAGPNQPHILLLMDNHGSHLTPEFVLLATNNSIVPFTFPAHLTHCMQPCDVGMFQTLKHQHSKAINYALDSLEFDYTISSFLRDLPEIRTQTFKKTTIKSAFQKSGIWPINTKVVLQTMSKYIKDTTPKPELPTLLPPKTPRTTHEFRAKWSSIQPRILDLLSSPSRRHFGSIERGLQNVLDVSDITQAERNLLYIRVNEVIRKKPTSRRRIQKGGELNAEYAQGLIREKEKKRSEKYTNKLALARTRTKNRVKRELNQLGVINRRLERSRVKTLKQVLPNDLGASHLTIPIPDPEKTANWEQIFAEIESTIPEGFGLETGDPETMFEDRPVELVEPEPMVQPSSGWLQDDFVAFEDSSSSASSDDGVFHSSP